MVKVTALVSSSHNITIIRTYAPMFGYKFRQGIHLPCNQIHLRKSCIIRACHQYLHSQIAQPFLVSKALVKA